MAVRAYALQACPGQAPGPGFAIVDFQKSGPTVVYADHRASMTPLGCEPFKMMDNALAGSPPTVKITAFGLRRLPSTPVIPVPSRVTPWGGIAAPAPVKAPVLVTAPATPQSPTTPVNSPLPAAPYVGPSPVEVSAPTGSSAATPATPTAETATTVTKAASSLPTWVLPAAIGAVVLFAGIGFASHRTSH